MIPIEWRPQAEKESDRSNQGDANWWRFRGGAQGSRRREERERKRKAVSPTLCWLLDNTDQTKMWPSLELRCVWRHSQFLLAPSNCSECPQTHSQLPPKQHKLAAHTHGSANDKSTRNSTHCLTQTVRQDDDNNNHNKRPDQTPRRVDISPETVVGERHLTGRLSNRSLGLLCANFAIFSLVWDCLGSFRLV